MGAEYHIPVYTEPTEARHDTSALGVRTGVRRVAKRKVKLRSYVCSYGRGGRSRHNLLSVICKSKRLSKYSCGQLWFYAKTRNETVVASPTAVGPAPYFVLTPRRVVWEW